MIRKLVATFVVLPLGLLLVAFAVANRHGVTLSLDLLGSGSPALSATVPLFLLVLVLIAVGVLIGGTAAWMRQAKWRRAARRLEGEARALRAEAAGLRAEAAARDQAALPPPSSAAA
jgi:uncharacterized integral membrane protein